MDISSLISLVEGAFRLAVDAPVLAIGVLVGAVGYNFLAKRYPSLVTGIVSKATDEVQALIAAELAKVTTAKAAQANITATTASVAATTIQDKSQTPSK